MMGIVCFTDIFTIKNVRRTVMKKNKQKMAGIHINIFDAVCSTSNGANTSQ